MAEHGAGPVLETVRRLAPDRPTVETVLRPTPLTPVAGRRVFYVTTAPQSAGPILVDHLESAHGATVTGTSHNLARRPQLAQDLERIGQTDVVLVELKAAGVDVVARAALEAGVDVVFCDNRVVTIGGDGTFEKLVQQAANLAEERFEARASRVP
jgi:cyclic 2,3-diphosphoglycerate synthetase